MGKVVIHYTVEAIFMLIIIFLLIGSNKLISEETSNDFRMTMVSGTEYKADDYGQIIVELRDRQYNPITASCNTTILYHNKSIFIEDGLMISSLLGTYYYNFTVPDVEGVYEYRVLCEKNGKEYIIGKSFHVTNAGLVAWITL